MSYESSERLLRSCDTDFTNTALSDLKPLSWKAFAMSFPARSEVAIRNVSSLCLFPIRDITEDAVPSP